jgi:pyruvate ferredoxin oxidoreductase gamma subunit
VTLRLTTRAERGLWRMPHPRSIAKVQDVFEVRIHGRGGQGVVTAAELLALAAFDEGRHSQAFPSFGSERTGAPVVAFCRIDNRAIRTREPIVAPDALIVQDPTLLHQVAVFDGLKPGAYVLVNTARDQEALNLGDLDARVLTVPATGFAREHLGRPLPNAALLGAFAALTGVVSLDSVRAAIAEKFPAEVAARNAAAATAAHDHVVSHV